jgi:hypothetical protein
MHSTNFRNLFHLYWSKVIIVSLFIFVCIPLTEVSGQGVRRKHLEYYDDKPIHYGILFAVPFTKYNFSHNSHFLDQDSAFIIESPKTTAFRMGFTINAYLNERFDLRTTPSVSLFERQLKLGYPNGSYKTEKRESTWIEIPLLLKYKSQRRGNSRMYLLTGFTLGVETNVKRNRSASSGVLNTKSSDLTLDYGIGFEQFFEFFKFAPELRFSHGLTNILNPSVNSATLGIDKLKTHTVTLYLNFE